jgi:hypothetical protein
MDSFDASKFLPQNIVLNGAQNLLYRIGLNLISNGPEKRRIFYNPLLIFNLNIAIVIKSIASVLMPVENGKLLSFFGDFTHFYGAKIHLNIFIIFIHSFALIPQIIDFYNYKNGIKQTYLKVFEMMSGLISPKSIGLTNKEEIYKMMKVSKTLFSLGKSNFEICLPLIVFLMSFVPFIINCSLLDIILFGIPQSILFTVCVHYSSSILFWPVVYFYIICRYIKIKIKEQNDLIAKAIVERNVINSTKILRSIRNLDAIYTELNEYNREFWSLYLLLIWLMFGFVINFWTYFCFFAEINIILKSFAVYGLVTVISTFLFIINTVSSVNYEANKSYKHLNQIMVYYSLDRIRFKTRNKLLNFYSQKIKVNINQLLI